MVGDRPGEPQWRDGERPSRGARRVAPGRCGVHRRVHVSGWRGRGRRIGTRDAAERQRPGTADRAATGELTSNPLRNRTAYGDMGADPHEGPTMLDKIKNAGGSMASRAGSLKDVGTEKLAALAEEINASLPYFREAGYS